MFKKNLNKIFLFVLIIIFSFVFLGCRQKFDEINMLSALPENSDVVFIFDYSNSDQVFKLNKFLNKIFDDELIQDVFDNLTESLIEFEIDYEKDMKSFLNEKWKIAFGGIISGSNDFEELEMYFLAQFSEANSFEKFLDKILEDQVNDLDIFFDAGIKYWQSDEYKIYIGRQGGLFVLSHSKENLDSAFLRIEEESGFDQNRFRANIVKLSRDNLLSMFVSKKAKHEMKSEFEDLGLFSQMNFIEDSFHTFSVDNYGFSFNSFVEIPEQDLEFSHNLDYELEFIDKINTEGMIFYMEESRLEPLFDALFFYYNEEDLKFFEKLISPVFDNPYAFLVSNHDDLIPNFGFYLKILEEQKEDAKKIMAEIDSYLQELIEEFHNLMEIEDEEEFILTRDVFVLEGGMIRKIYFNFESLPNEIKIVLDILPIDLEDLSRSFYYGITGNDILIFVLDFDFEENFGENILSENINFRDAKKRMPRGMGNNILMFQTQPLIDLIQNYVEIFLGMGFLTRNDIENIDFFVDELLGFINYGFFTDVYENGVLYFDAYLKLNN